jgi:acetyl esterase/lipase
MEPGGTIRGGGFYAASWFRSSVGGDDGDGRSIAHAQRPAGDAVSFAAAVGTGYRAAPNITYTTASGVELKLDFYRPAQASGPLPTAIFMHGGGYRIGSRKEASVLSLMPYIQMGWNAVNVEYRASGIAQAPAAVEDARCALRWVIHNAKEYNVDTERIVVTGQSAGSHLAINDRSGSRVGWFRSQLSRSGAAESRCGRQLVWRVRLHDPR